MRGAIPPLPQYAFMAWCSIKKAQGQLYLLPFYRYNGYYLISGASFLNAPRLVPHDSSVFI
jgi:hypothetical protein